MHGLWVYVCVRVFFNTFVCFALSMFVLTIRAVYFHCVFLSLTRSPCACVRTYWYVFICWFVYLHWSAFFSLDFQNIVEHMMIDVWQPCTTAQLCAPTGRGWVCCAPVNSLLFSFFFGGLFTVKNNKQHNRNVKIYTKLLSVLVWFGVLLFGVLNKLCVVVNRFD